MNGIEPIIGAALNATWPLLDLATTERLIRSFVRRAGKSKFAQAHIIPIADPTTLTISVYLPNELAELDIDGWLECRAVQYGNGAPSQNSGDPYGAGGMWDSALGRDKWHGRGDPRLGVAGQDDSYTGDPYGAGGMWDSALGRDKWHGRGDPRLGVAGQDDSYTGNPYQSILNELLGVGDPLVGLPGRPVHDPLAARAESLLGRGSGFAKFGWDGGFRNGGPLGFGSELMPGGQGSSDWLVDAWVSSGRAIKSFGDGWIHAGIAIQASGDNTYPELEIPTTMAGGLAAGVGLVIWGFGATVEKMATPDAPKPDAPKPDAPKPDAPKPDAPKPDAPKPAPGSDPHGKSGGLYPDPDGGGGGDPTMIWDENGGGVGPATIWDENGGGVGPATIWDENGGGVGPATIWDENGGGVAPNTVAGVSIRADLIAGPGLRANAVQIGPRTFA